jgi:hypothetical protein
VCFITTFVMPTEDSSTYMLDKLVYRLFLENEDALGPNHYSCGGELLVLPYILTSQPFLYNGQEEVANLDMWVLFLEDNCGCPLTS